MEKNENFFENEVCPACTIIDRFGDKWSLRVLILLHTEGVLRFNEMVKRTPGISQRMLSTTLKSLEADKLVSRKMYVEIPPRVEYRLTALGKSLIPHLMNVIEWAMKHSEEILRNRKKVKTV